MRTTSLNVDDYLFDMRQKVLQLDDKALEKEFDSFKEFIYNFIKENSVKNRLFYLVIPYSPYSNAKPLIDFLIFARNLFSKNKEKSSVNLNKEIALNHLNVRVELCKEKLKKCGLMVQRLDDNQMFSLLASFFDSYIEAKNDYFFPMTMLEKFGEIKNEKT